MAEAPQSGSMLKVAFAAALVASAFGAWLWLGDDAPRTVNPVRPEETAPSGGTEEPRIVRTGIPDNTPTSLGLQLRIQRLERRFEATGQPTDANALSQLDTLKQRVTPRLAEGDRRDVSKRLDSWERTFLSLDAH